MCEDRFGTSDSAYCFDGVDDYIDIADAPELNPTSEVTIAAWFNLETSHGNYWPPLARKADSAFGYELTMNGGPHSGVVYPGIQFDTVLDVDGFVVTNPATLITLNAWQFAVGVLDGSDIKLYLNGELDETDSATGNIIPTSHNLMIGGDPNPAIFGRFFDGAIDEVRIYNRALSESEIKELYRGDISVPINVDIDPYSCPNPVNIESTGGKIRVTIMGTDELDVNDIDLGKYHDDTGGR